MKSATKKATKKAAAPTPVAAAAAAATAAPAPINKQPQSNSAAASAAGVFLHTDDKWSLAYFDANDLHSVERELFG